MRKSIVRYTALLFILILLSTTGGVFATWYYAEFPATNVSGYVDVSLLDFEWKPEEILPTESEIGQNHLALIELILNEKNKGYGLNYDSKKVLEEYLTQYGIIFSNQKVSGGNLKFVSDETDQLYYCITKTSDTTYYTYTFTYDDLLAYSGTTTPIPVYLTILEKTDVWRATKSYLGYAKTKSLREMGASNTSNTLSYSIDVSSWALAG